MYTNIPTGLLLLPNELLIQILSIFSTKWLLSLAPVSHRFHELVLRIVHHRLIVAAPLRDRTLILECYHPTRKDSYLFCDYLDTPGLINDGDDNNCAYGGAGAVDRLGKLSSLYSRFRPVRRDPNGQCTTPSGEALVSDLIHLESHELFSQLCATTNLVRLGPTGGRFTIFTSFVNLADGVVRIWREWLAKGAAITRQSKSTPSNQANVDKQAVFVVPLLDPDVEARTAWVNSRKRDVGLLMRIKPLKNASSLNNAEDVAVSYELEYEELFVRTIHLLLAYEQTIAEENVSSGKAMIFGSFVHLT